MDANKLLKDKGAAVVAVHMGEALGRVIHLMAEQKIGAVAVTDENGKLTGIISERDVVRGLDKFGPDLTGRPVDDLVTTPVVTCGPHETLVEIMWSMDANGIRHLPVVDGENLVGMISIRDAISAWLNASKEEIQQLRELIAAERGRRLTA